MTMKKKIALAGSIFAALVMSAVIAPAEARRGGHGGGGGWGGGGMSRHHFSGPRVHSFSGPRVHSFARRGHVGRIHRGHAHHFRHHRKFFAYGPYVDTYTYGDSCYWLRRRALRTGSGYWWNRYYDCVNGYYYY